MLQRSPIILGILFSFNLISGCGVLHPHNIPVQQGNIITANQAHELKVGMTRDEVIKLLGTPLLSQENPDELIYAYSWEASNKPMKFRQLIAHFKLNRLTHYEGKDLK